MLNYDNTPIQFSQRYSSLTEGACTEVFWNTGMSGREAASDFFYLHAAASTEDEWMTGFAHGGQG
jgi:hypothetical protein